MKGLKSLNWTEIVVMAVVFLLVGVASQMLIEEETVLMQDGEGGISTHTSNRKLRKFWSKKD